MGITVTEDEPVEIHLKFKSILAPYILSQPIHATQKVIKSSDEGVVVSLQVLNTPELTTTILGFGEQVEIIEPTEIRNQVKDALNKSLSTYLK